MPESTSIAMTRPAPGIIGLELSNDGVVWLRLKLTFEDADTLLEQLIEILRVEKIGGKKTYDFEGLEGAVRKSATTIYKTAAGRGTVTVTYKCPACDRIYSSVDVFNRHECIAA